MSPGRQRFYRFVLLGCLVSLLSVRHAWTQSAADVEAKGLVGALTVERSEMTLPPTSSRPRIISRFIDRGPYV